MPEPCPTHDHMALSYHEETDRLRASWQPATTQVHRWSATCLHLLIEMGNEAKVRTRSASSLCRGMSMRGQRGCKGYSIRPNPRRHD